MGCLPRGPVESKKVSGGQPKSQVLVARRLKDAIWFKPASPAAKMVVVIGQRMALGMAVKNNETENRFSGLLARLTAENK